MPTDQHLLASPWWREQRYLDKFQKPTAVNKAKLKILLRVTGWPGIIDDTVCVALCKLTQKKQGYTKVLDTLSARETLVGLAIPFMPQGGLLYIEPTPEQKDQLQDMVTGRYARVLEERRLERLRKAGITPIKDQVPEPFDAVKEARRKFQDRINSGEITPPRHTRDPLPLESQYQRARAYDSATSATPPNPSYET